MQCASLSCGCKRMARAWLACSIKSSKSSSSGKFPRDSMLMMSGGRSAIFGCLAAVLLNAEVYMVRINSTVAPCFKYGYLPLPARAAGRSRRSSENVMSRCSSRNVYPPIAELPLVLQKASSFELEMSCWHFLTDFRIIFQFSLLLGKTTDNKMAR